MHTFFYLAGVIGIFLLMIQDSLAQDRCASYPCLNGATCTNITGGFTCTCTDGITGTYCDTEIDECQPNPCQNGGSCTDLFNDYSCSCMDGYTGTKCQTELRVRVECPVETDQFTVSPCLGSAAMLEYWLEYKIDHFSCSCLDNAFPDSEGMTCRDKYPGNDTVTIHVADYLPNSVNYMSVLRFQVFNAGDVQISLHGCDNSNIQIEDAGTAGGWKWIELPGPQQFDYTQAFHKWQISIASDGDLAVKNFKIVLCNAHWRDEITF